MSVVLISRTCCLTQAWNLSKIPHQMSCHAMRTMIGNDGSLDTSTDSRQTGCPPSIRWMSVEAEVFGQSGSPRFTCDFPAHNTAGELLGQGGAMQRQVSVMCQKNLVMTGCMRREETVNGGTWDEWFSSHQLHKNTRSHSLPLVSLTVQRNTREKNGLNFDAYYCLNLISDLSKCHFILFYFILTTHLCSFVQL